MGVKCATYHAGMDTEDRIEAHEKFCQDRITTIIATVAFGMGIDKPDVRFVIHYGAPKNVESYFQEIGRAGRDGRPSKCIAFYTKNEIAANKARLLKDKTLAEPYKRYAIATQKHMEKLLVTNCCRRFMILSHFDPTIKEAKPQAGCCDVCDKKFGVRNEKFGIRGGRFGVLGEECGIRDETFQWGMTNPTRRESNYYGCLNSSLLSQKADLLTGFPAGHDSFPPRSRGTTDGSEMKSSMIPQRQKETKSSLLKQPKKWSWKDNSPYARVTTLQKSLSTESPWQSSAAAQQLQQHQLQQQHQKQQQHTLMGCPAPFTSSLFNGIVPINGVSTRNVTSFSLQGGSQFSFQWNSTETQRTDISQFAGSTPLPQVGSFLTQTRNSPSGVLSGGGGSHRFCTMSGGKLIFSNKF